MNMYVHVLLQRWHQETSIYSRRETQQGFTHFYLHQKMSHSNFSLKSFPGGEYTWKSNKGAFLNRCPQVKHFERWRWYGDDNAERSSSLSWAWGSRPDRERLAGGGRLTLGQCSAHPPTNPISCAHPSSPRLCGWACPMSILVHIFSQLTLRTELQIVKCFTQIKSF